MQITQIDMKKLLILFLLLFSFVASGQSLIFGGSTNAAAREKLKGNASNYTINAPTDSTFYLVSTTKYTEIPLSNISSRSLTFTGSNGIAITGGTQTLSTNRTWSTRIDSTSTPVITGLRMKGLSTGLVHSNSVGTLSSSTLVNGDVSSSANIDATKLATGVVSNTEFNYLDSLTSQVAISIYNIAELKTKIGRYNQKVNVLFYSTIGDTGGGTFYWNKTSTATADDAMIVQVTGVTTGRWIRIVKDKYYVEWFGAKGDNSTDDTIPIQNCINYVATLTKGGDIAFYAKTYLVSHLYLKKWVNLIGAEKYLSAGATTEYSGTTIKNSNSSYQENFIELYADNSFPSQTGEIDGLSKSYPNFTIKNITFDGSLTSKYTFNISQSWGFSLIGCKFYRGIVYSLNITDCNEYIVSNCSISGFLSDSNADYQHVDNDIVGSTKTPSFFVNNTGVGITSNNKIYLGGDSAPYFKFSVTSINDGVFTISKLNWLPNNPNWLLQSSGSNSSATFVESTQTLSLASVNGAVNTTFTNINPQLQVGVTYKLTGTIILSGASSTRNVQFTCGNVSQTYGTINATTSSQNIDIDFTFNPSTNLTAPLKIQINSTSVTGTDVVTLANLKIEASSAINFDGVPLVFNYPSTANNNLKYNFQHSETFYPRFLSSTTMVLFKDLYNYTQNTGNYIKGTYTSLSGYYVEMPNCVMFLGGTRSQSGIYSNNKIEDISANGVVLRGAYNNVFSGNKISKGINLIDAKLFTFEKGATKNTIASGNISARINDRNDLGYIGVYCDEFSGGNNISCAIENNSYFDIFDEYSGEESSQNVYNVNVKSLIYQKKPTDYNYKGRGITFEKSKIVNVTNSTTLISNTEFTLHFENVKIANATSDVILFQQKDITNGSQDGRFQVKITSGGILYAIINATVVIQTASSTILANKYYTIDIVKDAANIWKIYVDGQQSVSATGISTSVATGGSTKSYVSSGETAQGGDLFMSGFMAFSEALTIVEIRNLISNKLLQSSVSSVLKNSKTDSTTFFLSPVNGSIAVSNGTGVDSGKSLLLSANDNNKYLINVSPTTIKGNLIRVSGYVKSSSLSNISIGRNKNAKNSVITTSYTKFSKLISPENTVSSGDTMYMSFGYFSDNIFGKDFTAKTGNIYLDYLKVSTGFYSMNTFLDFTQDNYNRTYSNKLSVTDVFSLTSSFGNFLIKEQGTSTLSSGTVTVSSVNVGTNSVIILTAQETGTLTSVLKVSSRVAGTSFTVTSSSGSDNAKFGYIIIN